MQVIQLNESQIDLISQQVQEQYILYTLTFTTS